MVDDSAAERKLYRMLLEETHGHEMDFCEATSAAQGLEMCRTAAPDCLLLDHKLPDMSGLEFLNRLRQESTIKEPNFAVVILTGLASEPAAVAALRAGAQDYLVKDRVTPESLGLVIEKATGKVSLIRALEAERDRLAASLAEKEVLLKEVHHRVKNNLQVIVSLLRLQAHAMHDAKLASVLWESQRRVESMALIHEQLYETPDLREIDLARHAGVLAAKLFHSYAVDPARIQWSIQLAPVPLTMDQAIPIGLILNELISNALKHAFPEGRSGSITVAGGARGTDICLEVRDDGIGLPANLDWNHPKSLGLEIVHILVRQLKGSFWARPGNGTVVQVVFPASR